MTTDESARFAKSVEDLAISIGILALQLGIDEPVGLYTRAGQEVFVPIVDHVKKVGEKG